ncbi:MAG: hypothetical protein R3360_06295, partial [Alphaproteobacteria bacterium]|nr:hypothetical protein [Alphaproteobacteria bacterium]
MTKRLTGYLSAFLLIFFTAAPHALAQDVIVVEPGENDHEAIQLALIEVSPGGTVVLGEGTFRLSDGLSLDVDGVTVRGLGKYRTVLSFKGQETGGEGLLVTSDDVTLSSFAVEDTRGDGIKAKDVTGIKML